ncbi:hypothetical protein GDO81_011552 [Engystomops pustulosus]|uniref:Uncharacterized protein n=1 Tax=Engystomops pustulosus TaxID=76066 RepID=A0AAV7BF10_ENGPU|nr:hypothetical protein GDO81_011552 [Engystomops pustulosus]
MPGTAEVLHHHTHRIAEATSWVPTMTGERHGGQMAPGPIDFYASVHLSVFFTDVQTQHTHAACGSP